MRRVLQGLGLLGVIVVVNVATVSLFLGSLPVGAGEGESECLVRTEDGDCAITLGDAIKIMRYLFTEGERPESSAVAAAPPPSTSPPSRTRSRASPRAGSRPVVATPSPASRR